MDSNRTLTTPFRPADDFEVDNFTIDTALFCQIFLLTIDVYRLVSIFAFWIASCCTSRLKIAKYTIDEDDEENELNHDDYSGSVVLTLLTAVVEGLCAFGLIRSSPFLCIGFLVITGGSTIYNAYYLITSCGNEGSVKKQTGVYFIDVSFTVLITIVQIFAIVFVARYVKLCIELRHPRYSFV